MKNYILIISILTFLVNQNLFAQTKPFDVDTQSNGDGLGRHQHSIPQIIGTFHNNQLTIAWKDYDSKKVRISQYNKNGDSFSKKTAKDMPNALSLLGGFTSDGSNFYCLTTAEEDMSRTPGWVHRNNILKLSKLDADANLVWEKELNDKAYNATPVYSPMNAGTAGLAYGNGKVGMISSSNSSMIDGSQRHQCAFRLSVNASDGSPAAIAKWFSFRHSFDQRIYFDGSDFVCMDLADSNPGMMEGAGLNLCKITTADNKHIKSSWRGVDWYAYTRNGNWNDTFISMGDIRKGNNGYFALFSTMKNAKYHEDKETRNLAMVHVIKDFQNQEQNAIPAKYIKVKTSLVDTRKGNTKATHENHFASHYQGNKPLQNTGIAWITDYTDAAAVRPKLFKIEGATFMVLWEKWGVTKGTNGIVTAKHSYQSTYALLIDEYGNPLSNPVDIGKKRLDSRQELFNMDGKAAWIIGDPSNLRFRLYTIDRNYNIKEYQLGL